MHAYLRMAGLACFALAMAACGRNEGESVSEAPPGAMQVVETAASTPQNLVIICVDTVRYDSLLGRPLEDALEAYLGSALHYRDASSTAPWTMPAVSSLLTGLYPQEHGAGRFPGVVANLGLQLPSALSDDATTLTERLRDQGFTTAAFISHPFFIEELGLSQGFQNVHSRKGWDTNIDRMWQWYDKQADEQRWFGYLHFMEAHDWHLASAEALSERLAAVPEQQLAALQALHPRNCAAGPDDIRCLKSVVYELAVLEMRLAIGTVLAGLEQRGELDDTMVVVYSDHGEEFWEHEAIQVERNEDPRDFKGIGHGQTLYQEQLHVPLLVWHPGLSGRAIDDHVSLVDVAPSVLTWLDVNAPGAVFSGQYLPPLGPGRGADQPLFASGIAYGPEQVAVRKGVEKSIYSLLRDEMELYNLASDPGELEPLDDPAALFEFITLTGDYLELPPRYVGAAGELSASQIEDLKAIGYLQGVEEGPAPAGEQDRRAAPIEIRATEDPEQP